MERAQLQAAVKDAAGAAVDRMFSVLISNLETKIEPKDAAGMFSRGLSKVIEAYGIAMKEVEARTDVATPH